MNIHVPDLLIAVKALLAKIDDWKSFHASHLEPMRSAAEKVDNSVDSTSDLARQELVTTSKAFLTKVQEQDWVIHETHLTPIRAGIEQELQKVALRHHISSDGYVAGSLTDGNDVDRALQLRVQALALMQEAQAHDGLKPFSVTHTHNNGESTYILWAVKNPSTVEAAAVLDCEFEPVRNETLSVEPCFTLEEMTGVAVTSRLNDILETAELIVETPRL